MSAATACALPPFAAISAATASAPAASLSAQTTAAPSSAKRRAVSRPMPDAAPVTTALLRLSLTQVSRWHGAGPAHAGMVSFRRWARCIRIRPSTANTLRQIRMKSPTAAT